jgi:hypothetical protein
MRQRGTQSSCGVDYRVDAWNGNSERMQWVVRLPVATLYGLFPSAEEAKVTFNRPWPNPAKLYLIALLSVRRSEQIRLMNAAVRPQATR